MHDKATRRSEPEHTLPYVRTRDDDDNKVRREKIQTSLIPVCIQDACRGGQEEATQTYFEVC